MENSKNKSSLRIVWFFLSQYRSFFFLLVLISITIGLLESLNVALMYPILNLSILQSEAVQNPIINILNIFIGILPINDELIRYSVVFIIIAILVFIIKTIYYFYSIKLTSRMVRETKQKIFQKCIQSDYQFFVDNKQGEILYKTSLAPNDISYLVQVLSDLFVELFLAVSVFSWLFIMSWKLVLIVIIGGIIYFYVMKYLSTKISYTAGIGKRDSGQRERVIVNEYTSGIKQIKVSETYSYWRNMFEKTVDTFWFHHRKNYFWNKIPEIALWLVLYSAIGVAIIFIKIFYHGRFMDLVPLVGTFAFGVFLVLPKISKFGKYRMQFMHFLPNVETVYDILRDTQYSTIENGIKKFKGLTKGISLGKVTYGHKERDILLKDVTFEIKKDQVTALVGPSGSGKSTIADLILRLYDVQQGGVFIDDVNIKEYDIYSFLQKVGLVSQDTFIYNASVKENISFGENYTDNQIIQAAKQANADTFITNLPQGYETIVGDRGVKLSGGEKQRLAIARAMIRKPEILLLDEATSSLDTISEGIVQKTINTISKHCTTFIIAHRLSTIQKADIIYVLDDGAIVECGTHKELLEKKGKYWELYNSQQTT